MSAESSQQAKPPIDSPAVGPALTPAERGRLQKVFDHGQQRVAKGEHDYAHDMFAACVAKDPGNLVYVEAMLDNLQRKYQQNKKGGRTKGNRAPFKKAVQSESWKEVIELGLELLKHNPWDVQTLRPMADACAVFRYNEVELRYLKNALDANPKDVDVNRHCARSLARMGQFDQSIACWHRIEGLLPNKNESNSMISKLTMAKNKWAQGILDDQLMLEVAGRPSHLTPNSAQNSVSHAPNSAGKSDPTRPGGGAGTSRQAENDAKAASPPHAATAPPPATARDPRARLEQAIVAHPTDVNNYTELAQLLERQGDLVQAEGVLRRALAVSGNNFKVQELLENVQLRRARHRLAVAVQQSEQKPSDAAETLVAQLREDSHRLELDIYERRSRRYPEDLTLQYELAVRLKRVRNYQAAADAFLASQELASREALARLNRGECLQQLHQYSLAMTCYREAVERAERDGPSSTGAEGGEDVLKLALYRAGTLASGLKDGVNAVKYLSQLVALDPDYRDAQGRLDKIRSSGHK